MRSLPAAPSRRTRITSLTLRIAAPVSLALGYADLSRGGLTAGPLLLVLGYFVLVPALILDARDA